jgi:hypothetical protein
MSLNWSVCNSFIIYKDTLVTLIVVRISIELEKHIC